MSNLIAWEWPHDHPMTFQHFSRNTKCFGSIRNLEIRDFDGHLSVMPEYTALLQRSYGGFLNLFHGLEELHIVESIVESKKLFSLRTRLRDNPAEVERCIQTFHQWYKDNAGRYPPQALRSIPRVILHDYRRIEARSDDGNREVGRIPCSLDKEETT
ncbi:hypothetical protein L207DRAFT_292148 [Hyaloscypha variabilis F]|uniref:Uncharacterized protein n=1 Tax=Hyaloscypha variabilis (strain UAMH 11265 / GT02V1 / F) TaxID=1149755 RepID=A0A2J6RXJ8_HYAVF|nr:hypothetical protein L207DRAFT_292148 [Hyaloscypha variabilis F]